MDKDYTDKIYKLNKNTDFWYEYLELTYKSYGDIRNNLMTRIKEKCDVPILTKMVLFSKPYNSNMAKDRTGMDGSGYEFDNLMDYGAGFRYGEMEAGNKAVFAATTEINRTASEHCYPNYPDIQAYFYDISVVHQFGSKITYEFFLDIDNEDKPVIFPNNYAIKDQRMLEWMELWHELITDKEKKIVNYKPYYYNSWPKADCWWNHPTERQAFRDTTDVYGINIVKAPNGVWVLNSWKADLPSDITFVTLNDDPGTSHYKEEFEKLLAKGDREIIMCGPRKNLDALSVDKYYTNEFFTEGNMTYQVLNVPKDAEIIHETKGKVWGMKIGKLQIISGYPTYTNTLEEVVSLAKLPKVKNSSLDAENYEKKYPRN